MFPVLLAAAPLALRAAVPLARVALTTLGLRDVVQMVRPGPSEQYVPPSPGQQLVSLVVPLALVGGATALAMKFAGGGRRERGRSPRRGRR